MKKIAKLRNIEKALIAKIMANYSKIMLLILLLVSVAIRIKLLDYESPDYAIFLKSWFNDLKEAGGLAGLGSYTGDYNAPYVIILSLLTYLPIKSLYSIKIVSIIFDYLLAIIGTYLVSTLTKKHKNSKMIAVITFATFIFLPTIITNSAFWAQCDAVYTFFIVASLLAMAKHKYPLSFILYGIAFSFKLQAIFILPAYLIYYLKEQKFSIIEFLWLPIMYTILSVPVLVMGKSLKDVFMVYVNQTGSYVSSLNFNFPNLYSLINFNVKYYNVVALGLTVLLFALLLYFILERKIKLDFKKLLLLSIISIIICTYYQEKIKNAIILELFSLNAYFMFLSVSGYVPPWLFSILLLYVLIDYIKCFFEVK